MRMMCVNVDMDADAGVYGDVGANANENGCRNVDVNVDVTWYVCVLM